MAERSIRMPDEGEMLKRLMRVDGSTHFATHLYEAICRQLAGEYMTAVGIAAGLGVVMASHLREYTPYLPAVSRSHLEAELKFSLIPRLIAALVDDRDVRVETTRLWVKEHPPR